MFLRSQSYDNDTSLSRLCAIAATAFLFNPILLSAHTLDEEDGATIEFKGAIIAPEDISAVAKVHEFLVIGSDEAVGTKENKNYIQLFKPEQENRFIHVDDILVFEGDAEKQEMDIEGLATVDDVVYILGSHSRKRRKVKKNDKYKKNRKKFHGGKIKEEASRGQLYRLKVTPDGRLRPDSKIQQRLREVIEQDPVLGLFARIPSKENGVDIEGLAADERLLYAGFRGPILRGGHVPVMRFAFDDPAGTYKLLYITLGGRGVRSLARVSDGFLILAGPLNNGPGTFQLYHWNGKDMIPGDGHPDEDTGKTTLLRDLAVPTDGKPEGLVVMEETDAHYDLILVFDGIPGAAPQRHRIAKH